MPKNSHTAGPWTKASQSEGGRYITIKAANGRTVARVPFNTEREAERGEITDDSDADLIASSPDLLTALETIAAAPSRLAFPDAVDQWKAAMLDAAKIARAAIAKAKGETK